MTKKFFITTPIYYSNDVPHIGHAYSTLIADTYARFKRLLGYEVKFSTWVDENSQKIVQKAEEAGIELYQYLDEFAQKHIAVWDALSISYTDFVRTTGRGVKSLVRWVDFQYDHHAFVQQILAAVHAKGDDIYQGEYEWLYCVWCEAFKKESDLVEATGQYEGIPAGTKVCPDHPNRLLEVIKEKNRFFALKKYQWFLEKFYHDNPDFVIPERRFAEVKSFVDGGLEDFSISREGKTFGIPLPFDTTSVSYVWFDALLNYVTVCQQDGFWTKDTEKVHVLGKDISRFHAIYWPAMLASAGLPTPDKEIVTGFFTVDGQKMSKSLWNVVNPVEVVEQYGRDALVFYLLYDIPIGTDGDFSWERFRNSYDAILCNSWGNLVNRVVTLCVKNWVECWKLNVENDRFDRAKDIEHNYLSQAQLKSYLDDWYKAVQKANEYMQIQQPWTKLKDPATREEGIQDLQFLLWVVKQLAVLSAPILTEWFAKMQGILGNEDINILDSSLPDNIGTGSSEWQFEKILAMEEFSVNLQPEILYQRVE